MKQKIEWYKEVLEIEPNSKVFFPLARILVADKQADEAIAVLTLGLSRHPYFIEARLLLVELLFANGRQERLWHEVDMVSAMLGGYPGFWKAWAERLSLEDGSRDTALAVSFVAASLQKLPISWTEVIEHGLKACFAKNGLSAPLPEGSGQTRQAGQPGNIRQTADAGQTQISSASGFEAGADFFNGAHPGASGTPGEIGVPFAAAETVAEDFTDIEGELANEAPDESSADLGGDLPVDLAGNAPGQFDVEFSQVKDVDLMDGGDSDLAADALAQPEDSATPSGDAGISAATESVSADLLDAEVAGAEALIPEEGVEPTDSVQAAGHPDDDDPENEEVYSLRTRSMAGILAEQGDYLGAREIYIELMELAANEAELIELKECAEEMQKKHSNQGQNQPFKPAEDAALSQSVRMNEQVMNKLKNLVDRLESRSQS